MAQVCARLEAFEALGARVFVVSFVQNPAWVRRWQAETCPRIPILLDPERRAYRAFGLERSVLRAWSPRTLWTYALYLLRGRRLKGILGDPHQLGGDFVLGAEGRMVFAHRSHDPTDRPPVEALLDAVRRARNVDTTAHQG